MKTLSNKWIDMGIVNVEPMYLEVDVKQFIKDVEDWCSKNNTIPLKDSKLRLAITDGGWINAMKLMDFIKNRAGDKLTK